MILRLSQFCFSHLCYNFFNHFCLPALCLWILNAPGGYLGRFWFTFSVLVVARLMATSISTQHIVCDNANSYPVIGQQRYVSNNTLISGSPTDTVGPMAPAIAVDDAGCSSPAVDLQSAKHMTEHPKLTSIVRLDRCAMNWSIK